MEGGIKWNLLRNTGLLMTVTGLMHAKQYAKPASIFRAFLITPALLFRKNFRRNIGTAKRSVQNGKKLIPHNK